MPEHEVAVAWTQIKKLAGMADASEKMEASLKLACFAYCCANGTSAEGSYDRSMQLSDGQQVPASVITKAVGLSQVRRFMKGNSVLSYEALKQSQCMEDNAAFIARRADAGIAPHMAFATADWLDDCPLFTPEETRVHRMWKVYATTRAKHARGGKSVRELNGERLTVEATDAVAEVTPAGVGW